MDHPYRNLPSRAFWRTGVSSPGPEGIRDLGTCRYRLKPTDALATAGSCFAQHIARALRARGFSCLDVEPPPPLLPESDWPTFGYRLYSARYGNIYTSRQLLQMLMRAFGRFTPEERVWQTDGRWFDPFRPSIEPNGFESEQEALASQASHLMAVRDMVRKMDVFIFTLGLTETWASRSDGAVYPTCPGVQAGSFDPDRYEFVNLTYPEIFADMRAALTFLRRVRPQLRVILTVSPVPLTATATGQHVLTATTYSKSVLRAVAGQLSGMFDWVDYFPSYELVTAPVFRGDAFAANLREVRLDAVDGVLGHFMREFCDMTAADAGPGAGASRERDADLVCDEQVLDFYGR